MLIAYNPIYQSQKEDEFDTQPDLFVGSAATGVCVTMTSDNFDVKHVQGKARVILTRIMTPEQMRELGEALVQAADSYQNIHIVTQ